MVSFGEKAKTKKAGNLNQGRSYLITTVQRSMLSYLFYFLSPIGESLTLNYDSKGQLISECFSVFNSSKK